MNVIATALLADTPKLACTALNFFLNIDTMMADDDEEEGKAETAPTEVCMYGRVVLAWLGVRVLFVSRGA